MFPQAGILCVGHDPTLLQTRKWMLEGQFEVELADTLTEALNVLRSRTFDLVLLCHSLNDLECKMICDAVFSQAPATRVLQLNEGWREVRSLIGPLEQTSAAKPQNLIQKITEMAERARGAHRGPANLSGAH